MLPLLDCLHVVLLLLHKDECYPYVISTGLLFEDMIIIISIWICSTVAFEGCDC